MSKNVVTLKSGSEVTQGHWKFYHSVDRVYKYKYKYKIKTYNAPYITRVIRRRDFVYGFLLLFFSNFVPKRTVFEIFDF